MCTAYPRLSHNPYHHKKARRDRDLRRHGVVSRMVIGRVLWCRKVALCFFFLCIRAATERRFLLLFLLIFTRVPGICTLCKFLNVRRQLTLQYRYGFFYYV